MNCEDARANLDDSTAHRHVLDCDTCLDAIVVKALEAAPDVIVPAGLAKSVRAELAAQPIVERWPRSGSVVAVVLLVIGGAFTIAGSDIVLASSNAALLGTFAALMGVELAVLLFWLGRATRL